MNEDTSLPIHICIYSTVLNYEYHDIFKYSLINSFFEFINYFIICLDQIAMDPPPFSSLSTVDIKEMLHKKQIDSVGIYDREALIQLALGKAQEIDFGSQIPESYIELFEVMGFFIIFYQ